jgi:hypothetical protein
MSAPYSSTRQLPGPFPYYADPRRPDYVPPQQTRVFLHVLTTPHPTVPTIMAAAGVNRSTAWEHLRSLRTRGLVEWTDGQHGTIRPLLGLAARAKAPAR